MWRILLFLVLSACAPMPAWAGDIAWQACRGTVRQNVPSVEDCRPLTGVIDPQGREIWLRASVRPPSDARPHALYVVGAASSEAWLNGRRLGANGRPGGSAAQEGSGRYEAAFPVSDTVWRSGENELVLHMSSFHGRLRLATPIAALTIGPYPYAWRRPVVFVGWLAAGALIAGAFGFGVIHLLRRTSSSLLLAALAGVCALQAVVESLRSLVPYPYPLHAWRLCAIWLLAACFAVLLVNFTGGRFLPKRRRLLTGLVLAAAVGASALPSFDEKTGWTLFAGVLVSLAAAAAGVRARQPGARLMLAYLAVFAALAVGFPEWLADLSLFIFAAGLVLPLLMVEIVRLGRDDRRREAALTAAASRPDRLTVASAGGVELVPIPDIVAIIGADDYAELTLIGGRTLLHAARLDRLEAQLPPNFVRIHRSSIANLDHAERLIRETGRWRLRLRPGQALPVSNARLATLRDALREHGNAVTAAALKPL